VKLGNGHWPSSDGDGRYSSRPSACTSTSAAATNGSIALWLLELAGDLTPLIDQAQSLNLFIPADCDKWDLLMLHFRAWELGIKSLYYLRSKSVQRAGFAGGVEADNTPELREIQVTSTTDYDECLACQ